MRHSETPSGSGSTTPSKSKHNLEGWCTPTPSQSDVALASLCFSEKHVLSQLGVPEVSTQSFYQTLYFSSGQNLYSHSSCTARKRFCRSRPFCKAIKREGKDFQVQAGKAWIFPAIKLSGKAFCIVNVRNTGRITIVYLAF